jgi:nucleosome binding factor SPN SPT16 subunit
VAVLGDLVAKVKEDSRGEVRRFVIIEKKEDLASSAEHFIESVKKELPAKPRIGMIEKEPQKGKYADALHQALTKNLADGQLFDISEAIAEVLSIKRPQDIPFFEKCAKFVTASFKDFVARIQKAANEDELINQNKLSDELNKNNENQITKYCRDFAMETDFVYGVIHPLIQSGGQYSFKTSGVSASEPLRYDSVVLSFTGAYFDLKVSATRTLLFGPTAAEEDDYKLV